MSTKIYYGFRVRGLTLKRFHAELQKLRPKIEKLADEEFRAYFVRESVRRMDSYRVKKKLKLLKEDEKPFDSFQFYMECQDEWRKIDRESIRSTLDWSCEISLFPLAARDFLCCYFTERDSIIELIQAQPWFTEYAYYNNTDQPDDISDEEWEQRKRDWDIVFPHWGDTPAKRMFTLKLTDTHRYFPWHKRMSRLAPDYEKRVRAIVRDLVFNRWINSQSEVNSKNFLSLMFDFNDLYKKPDSFPEWRQEFESVARKTLPKRITTKMLSVK